MTITSALTVHKASIHTAAVSINTLTISGKQVTLAVFRQLQSAKLINDDGSFAGLPWGTVNYHGTHCNGYSGHVHVVWQLGDQLRRDEINPPRWDPFRSAAANQVLFRSGELKPGGVERSQI
jgi:hypothetical protein